MKSYWAVFSRELVRRIALWPAAVAAGLLPFLIAAIPGMTYGYAEVRDASAFILAVALGVLLAFILGATIIGRDLSEGRLGFDFAKPIGGFAIWAARFTAALAMVWGVSLITILPSTIAGGGLFRLWGIENPAFFWSYPAEVYLPGFLTAVAFALFLLACVALAHVLSVMARARSAWLFLDLGGLILVTFITFFSVGHLSDVGGWRTLPALVIGLTALGILFLFGLLAAGAAQVCAGRTDLLKGHRALSIILWSVFLVGALSFAGYAHWYTNVSPSDFAAVGRGYAAPKGDWIYVSGTMRHRGDLYNPGFLFNTVTGKWLKVRKMDYWSSPVFSGNGNRCAWFRGHDTHQLVTVKLNETNLNLVSTNITIPGINYDLALSPLGDRCAFLSRDGQLVVYELDTERLLASARIYGSNPQDELNEKNFFNTKFSFRGEDKVSIIRIIPGADGDHHDLLLQALDIAAGSLKTTGKVEELEGQCRVRFNSAGDRFILGLYDKGHWGMSLRDGMTGELLAPLPVGVKMGSAAFLGDGRVVAAGRMKSGTEGHANLWVYSQSGALERTIDLSPKHNVILGGEPEANQLFARLFSAGRGGLNKGETYLVNLDTGVFRPIGEHMRPLIWYWWFGPNVPLPTGASGRLLVARDGSLVRADPDTGAREVLIRGHLEPGD